MLFWTCSLNAAVGPRTSRETQFLLFSPGIENLPFELQRNFQLMRDLDQRTEGTYRVRSPVYSECVCDHFCFWCYRIIWSGLLQLLSLSLTLLQFLKGE